MGKKLSLDGFARFITETIQGIERARREIEEVQVGFNSAYVEWKAPHDATLEQLVGTIDERLQDVGADLRGRIAARQVEEHATIAARLEELETTLIPETQAEADQMVVGGQRIVAEMRELNPRLDREEETLKEQRNGLRAELDDLNKEIRRLSGCFVVVLNYFKLTKLDRQRQKVIGRLQVIENHLKRVREEWETAQEGTRSQQEALKERWRELTIKLAEMQAERDRLAVAENREELARRRAIRHIVDNLTEDLASPDAELKRELDRMVELNIQTDEYEDALSSVIGLLAMLDGVVEGMRRFSESVDGLQEEQRMHGANLPKLTIDVPDSVTGFHQLWPDLARQVRDERHLAANPDEFMALVAPVTDEALSDDRIDGMFGGLGQALEKATKRWRG
jgi:chromosome segregation ATPase